MTDSRARHGGSAFCGARLRIRGVQLVVNLNDPAMEDALYDSAAVQRFVGLTARDPQPDATTTLRFGRLLERHHLGEALLPGITRHLAAQGLRLREGTIVYATSVDEAARAGQGPGMHQVNGGNQWYSAIKAHIGGRRGHGAGA